MLCVEALSVTGINRAYFAFLDALAAEQETTGPFW